MIHSKGRLTEFYNKIKDNKIEFINATYTDGDLLKDVNYYLGRLSGDQHVEKINTKVLNLLKNYENTITFKLGGDEYLTFFESLNDAKKYIEKSNIIEIDENRNYIDFLKQTNITTVGMTMEITDHDKFIDDINKLDLLCSKYKGHKYLSLPSSYREQMCRISHDKTDIYFIDNNKSIQSAVKLNKIKFSSNNSTSLKFKLLGKDVQITIN